MTSPTSREWSDNDNFWIATYPFEFNPSRLAAAPGEAARVPRLTGTAPGSAILDMACGPGRHAIEFARAGHQVTGVDVTRGYIDMARQSARKAGVEVDFLVGDARTYERPNTYDLVTNLFTSFGYFEKDKDNIAVLAHAYTSLKPGGRFIIDTVNGPAIAQQKRVRDRRTHQGATLDETSVVSDDGQRLAGEWTLARSNGSQESFHFTLWLYSAADLQNRLASVGFSRIATSGSLAGDQYYATSTRLVMVATK